MARDMSFWKCNAKMKMEDKEIYSILSNGENIQGIEYLPIDSILSDVKCCFSDWKYDGEVYKKDGEFFEVTYTEQLVRFDCYSMSEYNMNKIIDIMLEYECPLYDSAIDVRFS